MESIGLMDLSTELLVDVLGRLHFTDLVLCRRVGHFATSATNISSNVLSGLDMQKNAGHRRQDIVITVLHRTRCRWVPSRRAEDHQSDGRARHVPPYSESIPRPLSTTVAPSGPQCLRP